MRGFNDLGRSFDGSFSLSIFYGFRKNENNLSSRSLNILQNAPSNSVHSTSSFSCAAVSNVPLRAEVCDKDGKFEIINATDSLIQNIIRANVLKSRVTVGARHNVFFPYVFFGSPVSKD